MASSHLLGPDCLAREDIPERKYPASVPVTTPDYGQLTLARARLSTKGRQGGTNQNSQNQVVDRHALHGGDVCHVVLQLGQHSEIRSSKELDRDCIQCLVNYDNWRY